MKITLIISIVDFFLFQVYNTCFRHYIYLSHLLTEAQNATEELLLKQHEQMKELKQERAKLQLTLAKQVREGFSSTRTQIK